MPPLLLWGRPFLCLEEGGRGEGLPTTRIEKNVQSSVKKLPQMEIFLQKGIWKNAPKPKLRHLFLLLFQFC